MAYGVLLGQRPKAGLGAKVYLTAYQDTSSLTNVTATGQNTGRNYTASYNETAQAFIFSIDVYDTYTFSGVLNGNTLTQTAVVDVSKKIDVVLPPALSSTLNDNSWAAIRYAADNNLGSSVWSVGDAKQITLNGTVGILTLDNYQPYVYILGFNHNAEREGQNMIHFGCFRTAQNYSTTNSIALDDNRFSNDGILGSFSINVNQATGWELCQIRINTINSNANNPNNASANSFLSALPSDLQTVLKQCTKYTDNVGDGTNVQSNVTATQDWAFLLSEFEIFGTRTSANQYEQQYQHQYQYYIDGNSKIKYRQSSTNNSTIWWERSPSVVDGRFCLVLSNGEAGDGGELTSWGFAPAFCI